MSRTAVKERTDQPALFDTPRIKPPKKKQAVAKTTVKHKPKPSTALAKAEPVQQRQIARSEPKSFLQVIMEAVSDPRCDIGKMRELLAMQREIEQEEARRAFISDFMALTDDLPTVTADRAIVIRAKDTATQERTGRVLQSTPYASFNAMMRVLKKPLKQHGFSLSYATEPSADSRLNVTVFLDHRRGHQRKTIFPLPAETSGSKNNIQGWGSAQSYGMRYGTRALLNIITAAPEDADTDGVVHQVDETNQAKVTDQSNAKPTKTKLSIEDVQTIQSKMTEAGVTLDQFLTKYSVKAIIDLPVNKYADAIAALDNHIAIKKQKAKA